MNLAMLSTVDWKNDKSEESVFLEILKSSPLYLQVYHRLKDEILEGRWEPGEKLIESKIATDINLSRSPVREAMRILEYEGLLVKKDASLFVHQPSVKDIIELYQLRFSLEALSCYLAAEYATEEEVVKMGGILQKTEYALKKEDLKAVYQWNTQFHEAIFCASKNNHLVFIMEGLRAKVLYCRNVLIHFDYFRLDNFYEEHFAIYQAIKNGDKKEAKALMETHIKTDLERILTLFPEQSNEGGLTNEM